MARPTPRRKRSTLERIGMGVVISVLAIALLVPMAVFGVVALPAIPILLLLDHWRRRRFHRRYAGQTFIIVQRARGWRDFVVNNLEPVLPAGTSLIWREAPADGAGAAWYLRWRVKRPAGIRRPYAVVISRKPLKVRFVPLHDVLLPLKPRAKRTAETQRAVAEALERTFQQSRV